MSSRIGPDDVTDEPRELFTDVVALLRARAHSQPTATAYVFLEDGERESSRTSFSELDRRARGIAAHLQQAGTAGRPVLLLYPPGLEYIEAFFAGIYRGLLLAVRLIGRLRQEGLHVDVRALFDAPTVAVLATAVSGNSRSVQVPATKIPDLGKKILSV